MLSDFSAISPVWIRYRITEINMESIERNGLYDQIIIISGKKMKHLFNPTFFHHIVLLGA